MFWVFWNVDVNLAVKRRRLRIIYYLFSEKTFEPFDRSFGISGVIVFVIDIVEPKSGGVPPCPFPIVQQRPRKIPAHVTPILVDRSSEVGEIICVIFYPFLIV